MSHLYIAGDVASVAFSLGERLVDLLKSRLQDFKFTKLVCPSNNWGRDDMKYDYFDLMHHL